MKLGNRSIRCGSVLLVLLVLASLSWAQVRDLDGAAVRIGDLDIRFPPPVGGDDDESGDGDGDGDGDEDEDGDGDEDACDTVPSAVPGTGQMDCWDEWGLPIECAGTGQDGEFRSGAAANPRFTNNGNGTVTDHLTGLIWLRDANCFGPRRWVDALADVNVLADGSCGLSDTSSAGNWRLPNVNELRSVIDYGQAFPALPPVHPFSGVQLDSYWSSTSRVEAPNNAWRVNLRDGTVVVGDKIVTRWVWPVRGGP